MLSILFPGTSNAFAGLTNDPLRPIADGPDHPRRNSCLAIRGGNFTIGVDLGYGAFDGLIEAGWPLPDGFLLTHNHYDHRSSESVDRFARWAKLLGKRPWVLATERTWSAVSEFHKGHFSAICLNFIIANIYFLCWHTDAKSSQACCWLLLRDCRRPMVA